MRKVLEKSNNKIVDKFFRKESHYGAAPFLDFDYIKEGIKIKFVEASYTKDSFIVEGLFNVRLSEQVYIYYPKLQWKYHGMIIRILDEDIGLVEIAVFEFMWLTNWWVASQKERENDENIFGYIILKNFVLFDVNNITHYKTFYMSWISFIQQILYVVWTGYVTVELWEVVQVNVRELSCGLNETFYGQVTYIGERDGYFKIWIKIYGGVKNLRGKFWLEDFYFFAPKMLVTIAVSDYKIFFY